MRQPRSERERRASGSSAPAQGRVLFFEETGGTDLRITQEPISSSCSRRQRFRPCMKPITVSSVSPSRVS